ncbi:MAG TPA: DUF2461 domain-containing protein [Paludibacteraceae bacterium]|nr:DUF2461 domain-containing protein [Paludibacteraceae bacterium]
MTIQKILDFLSVLSKNNNREWFAQNKSWYDEVRSGYLDMSNSLIMKIAEFDPEIKHVDIKDCIFRIYRDIRFSPDKSPYKTHFGAYIAAGGGRKSQRGGYYFHLQPESSFVSVGIWSPEPNVLKALRKSVYENIDEFNDILSQPNFKRFFDGFFEDGKLKKVPAGFPGDFPQADLLKLKHYATSSPLDGSILTDENPVPHIAEILEAGYPLNRFLNFTLDELF